MAPDPNALTTGPHGQVYRSVSALISVSRDCTSLCSVALAAAEAAAHSTDRLFYSLSFQTAVHAVKLQIFVFVQLLAVLIVGIQIHYSATVQSE